MPNAGAKNFLSLTTTTGKGQKGRNGAGQQKSSKSFSDLLLSLAAPMGGWYSVLGIIGQSET